MSPCHECWKVRNGFGNSDNICQFQGFRKIRKVEASARLGILPFEACGFLDPYSDPTEEDKRIWQVNDFQIHPEMTPEVAKYVFKHASDEFCSMVHDEQQEIDLYQKDKNNKIIWKRLQPQGKEAASLMHIHNHSFKCGKLHL